MIAAVGLAAALSIPDPYEIYARARARWAAQRYPRYLSYDVKISGITGTASVTNTYASFADTATGAIYVHATSAQEAAHPGVPHGIDVKAKLKISYSRHSQLSAPSADGDVHASVTMPVTQREQYDLLGVPLLSPAYSFGLMPEPVQTAVPHSTTAQGLKTIAAVRAVHRDYDIRYAGIEAIDGEACFHLHLSPRRDPQTFRLREVWIDARDFTTRQAALQGNFTSGPSPALPWLIRFAVQDRLMYVRSESAMTPVRYLGRTYENVGIAFENVKPAGAAGLTWSLSMFRTSGDVLREPAN